MVQKSQEHSLYLCACDGSRSPDWSEQACTLGSPGKRSKYAVTWAPHPEILCSLYRAGALASGFSKPTPGDANVHPEWRTAAVKGKVLDLEVRSQGFVCFVPIAFTPYWTSSNKLDFSGTSEELWRWSLHLQNEGNDNNYIQVFWREIKEARWIVLQKNIYTYVCVCVFVYI